MAEHVLQHDGAALNRGKRDEDCQCAFDECGIGTLILGFANVGYVGNEVDVLTLVATQKIHGGVVRNTKQPSAERRRLAHLTEREVRLCEGVLHDVLAVEDIARHARAVPMKLGTDLGDELHEACPRFGHRGEEIAGKVTVAHASGSTPFPDTPTPVVHWRYRREVPQRMTTRSTSERLTSSGVVATAFGMPTFAAAACGADSDRGTCHGSRSWDLISRKVRRSSMYVATSVPDMAIKTLVIQAAHGQVDGSSRHPARLVGRHEDRHVCHLLEPHDPPRVGHASEVALELFPGHARYLGLDVEVFLHRACLRYAVRSQTDHADALRCALGG